VRPIPDFAAIARTLALTVLIPALAGCVSLLPKSTPAALYRFGDIDAPAAAAAPGPAAGVLVAKGQETFEAAASTDRILTATGDSLAYIGAARWVAPAPVLFDEAVVRAFQAPGAPRLAERGAAAATAVILTLDVQTFEARYDQGPAAPPLAQVQIHAALLRADTRTVLAEQEITASARAADNRVGPIVAAYDAAVKDALGKLVAWTGQNAR
jgi:cholesterol transport system auxiliary component